MTIFVLGGTMSDLQRKLWYKNALEKNNTAL